MEDINIDIKFIKDKEKLLSRTGEDISVEKKTSFIIEDYERKLRTERKEYIETFRNMKILLSEKISELEKENKMLRDKIFQMNILYNSNM